MSLLNDALRKKRIDQQPDGMSITASLPNHASPSNRTHKLKLTIIISVLVMVAATLGGWFYWAESDAAPDQQQDLSSASTPDLSLSSSEEKPATGKPIAGTAPIELKMPEASTPLPVKAAPTIGNVSDLSIKNETLPTVKPPVIEIPSKALAKPNKFHPPEKKTTESSPRKKSSPKARPLAPSAKAIKASAASRRSQNDLLYKKARQYHRQDRIHQAIDLYREVIKIDPEHYKARFNLSAAYLQIEAYNLAYPIIAELHRREPDNQQVKLNFAIAHIGQGRYTKAIELLDQIAGQPSAPMFKIAFHKGIAYSQMNQMQSALDWYKRAEALRPEDPGLLFNLAVLFDQQQQFKAAVDYYSRCLDHMLGSDALKEKQIRKRIRTLLTYYTESNLKE